MTPVPSLGSVEPWVWAWNLIIVIVALGAGLSWGRLLAPASSPLTVVLLGPPVGLALTAAIALPLAMVGLLSASAFALGILGIGSIPLLSARWRSSLRWRPRRSLSLSGGVTVVLLLAVVALWPSLTVSDEGLLPAGTTTWYYDRLASLVAERGAFPAELREWGTTLPFQTDYAAVTAGTAGFLQLLAGNELLKFEIYRVAVLVAVFCALTLLFRRWSGLVPAAIAASLVLNTTFLFTKFVSYKPETPALVFAILGLWLLDRYLVERRGRLAIAVSALTALVVVSHAEIVLVYLAFAVGIVVARNLSPSKGWRPKPIRSILDAASGAILIGASGLVAGVLLHSLIAGEFRLLDYVRTDVATPTISADVLPAGWELSDDPTWNFSVAAIDPDQVGMPPPTTFSDPRLLPRSYLRLWSAVDLRGLGWVAAIALVALVPIGFAGRLGRRERTLIAWWIVAGVVLLAGAYIAATISETYVPRRVGPRRLAPYEVVPITAALISFMAMAWRVASRALGRVAGRRAITAVGLLTSLAVCLALLGTTGIRGQDENPGLTSVGWEALTWIDGQLPADAVIVSNLYTDGSLTTLTRRSNLLDGRAGYLEDPGFLGRTTEALLASRKFFQAPDDAFGRRYLGCMGVDYVLVATDPRSGDDLGGSQPFETSIDRLRGMPELHLVRNFDERVLLFEVDGIPPSTGACFG